MVPRGAVETIGGGGLCDRGELCARPFAFVTRRAPPYVCVRGGVRFLRSLREPSRCVLTEPRS